MTKEKLLECVSIAYNYGIQQPSNRCEPKYVIFAWCGYSKIPELEGNVIYASYKTGRNKAKELKNDGKMHVNKKAIISVVSKFVIKLQDEVDTTQEKLDKDKITQIEAIKYLEQIRELFDRAIYIIDNGIGQMSLGDGKSD